ncbi:MAG: NUDIX domain-containing protein [Candidatus Liptonbacteria bacterium]|nr:NUDIX domain-containing protein [Candidatus Liptonbacteria bacterium]
MTEKISEKIRDVKKQVVAGFIVYRRTSEGIKFLFLYRRGGYWNFPKGHFEHGENALATAFRETEEETGLKRSDLHLVPGFKAYVKFSFFHGGKKIYDTVILHLAETRRVQVTISPREHSGFAWFLYHDAIRMLGKYQGTKNALKDAYDFLRRKSYRSRPAFAKLAYQYGKVTASKEA